MKTSPEQAKRRGRRLHRRADRWWSGTGSNCRPSAFQGSYHPGRGHSQSRESAQVTRIGADHLACRSILAVVPPCAGECRLVRVTGVLIFVNGRSCVAFVLLPPGPLNHRRGTRLRTGWWACPGVTGELSLLLVSPPSSRSGAMLGITYRGEQACARRFEPRITMPTLRLLGDDHPCRVQAAQNH